MVRQYLEKYQKSLLKEKADCEEEYEKTDQKIKSNLEFREILAQKSDPDYEAFTPHVVHPREKEKISELKVEEEKLRKRKDELKTRITELEGKLDELKSVITEALETEKQQEKKKQQERIQDWNTSGMDDPDMLITKLELCEKIALVDPHRCQDELRLLLEKVKEWKDGSTEER